MNRRDAIKSFAGALGLSLVDPAALIRATITPAATSETVRQLIIPAGRGVLITGINAWTDSASRCSAKLQFDHEIGGIILPSIGKGERVGVLWDSAPLWIPSGTIELIGDAGVNVVFSCLETKLWGRYHPGNESRPKFTPVQKVLSA